MRIATEFINLFPNFPRNEESLRSPISALRSPLSDLRSLRRGGLATLTLILFLLIIPMAGAGQTPEAYWRFDTASPADDAIDTFDLTILPIELSKVVQNSKSIVGGYLQSDNASSFHYPFFLSVSNGNLSKDDSVNMSVEFLMRLNHNFHRAKPLTWDDRFEFRITDVDILIHISLIGSATKKNERELIVSLNGFGRKDSRYYTDGKWHHFVVSYTAKTGIIHFYVDGIEVNGNQSITGSSLPINPGGTIDLAPFGDWELGGYLDEVAIYDEVLGPKAVYMHYANSILNGIAYSFLPATDPNVLSIIVPKEPEQTAELNIFDFAPGYPDAITETPLDLLESYQSPRYLRHQKLPEIVPWVADWDRVMGETFTDYSEAAAMQRDLIRQYNYALSLGSEGDYDDTLFYNTPDTFKPLIYRN